MSMVSVIDPVHNCNVSKLSPLEVPDPDFGDVKLNVFPFINNERIQLPNGFQLWEPTLQAIMEHVPYVDGCDEHYVTIDSKFFTVDDFLRREGVHIDGNFCADPQFAHTSWGGTRTSWGGTTVEPVPSESDGLPEIEWNVVTPWVSPYGVVPPIGTYVSDTLGGIFCVSSEVGCRAWTGRFVGEVMDEGSFETMLDQLTDDREVIFDKNTLYFMTSNTPHESLKINKGTRRTFMRVTLNHKYPNEKLLI